MLNVVCAVVQGRFTIAAKHHMTIAEIYETDMVDHEKVMHFCDHAKINLLLL